MKENFDALINKIERDLPDLITNEMLLEIGLGSHILLFRLRESGFPYVKISSKIHYLKSDIIDLLKKSYQTPKEGCLAEEGITHDSKI